jgi:uncharacterized membrane protein
MQLGDRRVQLSGILLGLGFGGFFDGIVFHQILQWHHMVSHVDRYPTNTVAGLEDNTLADGLFHVGTLALTVIGVAILWSARRDIRTWWSTRGFVGLIVAGWGLFNVVEGLINHQILGVHRVKENAGNLLAWDLAFLAWGAIMLAGGWMLYRSTVPTEDGYEPRATGA